MMTIEELKKAVGAEVVRRCLSCRITYRYDHGTICDKCTGYADFFGISRGSLGERFARAFVREGA